ncbi:MAG: KEOPS complex subunit Cgi121 [Thermofilaceae archaeon]
MVINTNSNNIEFLTTLINDKKVYVIAYLLSLPEEGLHIEELLDVIRQNNGTRIVVINPSAIVSISHVLIAMAYALKTYEKKRNVARTFHIEVMLFIAATNDISKALSICQPVNGLNQVLLVDSDYDLNKLLERMNKITNTLNLKVVKYVCSDEKLKLIQRMLNISENEIMTTYSENLFEAIEKCLLSRMALEYLSR